MPRRTALAVLLLAGTAAAADPGAALPPGAVARLGTLRLRSDGSGLPAVAFTPDGRSLVTAEAGAGLRVWDVASGQLRRHLDVPAGTGRLALSPDGRRAATEW